MTTVQLADYDIVIGDFTAHLNQLLEAKKYSQCLVLVDENTKEHCLPILLQRITNLRNAPIIEIQSGEIHKNIETCQYIWQQLLHHKTDRKALVINLGGGVIGDMGGFCASTFKRGIDFLQIPTTLLAQVDASIGGKLGIDFEYVKNIIGCFNNPQAVYVEPLFLQSLPERQVRNGFAEVIKHALICDAAYWQDLKTITDFRHTDWTNIIHRSLQIKRQVVETDPYEKGLRKILNFGHTIGHAIESYSMAHDSDPLLHGEAIVLGMYAELYLSEQVCGMDSRQVEQVKQVMQQWYTDYQLAATAYPNVLDYLKNDKKNEGKHLNFTLLEKIG
ncbi:MAG: 3-dehydroquinate synthase, partial [Chitinophagales bacterium]